MVRPSGGEAVGLGLLRHDHCFAQTIVLPRDYYGVGRSTFDTKDEVLEVARHIAFAADLDDSQKKTELRGLITTARDAGITITEHELTEFLSEERTARDATEPSYSWVHLALFRRFEEATRCRTWHSGSELREVVDEIAFESPNQWDLAIDSDDPS